MTTSTPTPGDGELRLSPLAAAQFTYHVRMTAVFALAGETQESASEALLAWTMLSMQWPDAEGVADGPAGELIGQNVAGLSEATRQAAAARAHGLAVDIESHYVSVGCHDEATFYADVAERVADAAAELVTTTAGDAATGS